MNISATKNDFLVFGLQQIKVLFICLKQQWFAILFIFKVNLGSPIIIIIYYSAGQGM